jgi:hypothetical protein
MLALKVEDVRTPLQCYRKEKVGYREWRVSNMK